MHTEGCRRGCIPPASLVTEQGPIVESPEASAFAFTGSWRGFAPIAFTNLLLIIVTLGIYTFWATVRERRYLWSHTRFVDEPLEWTGAGTELFLGFLLVVLLLGVPAIALQFGVQALTIRGEVALAGAITFAGIAALFYLIGVARFRVVRYRLARTRWRGIRGGSDERGFLYGTSYVWKTLTGVLPAGLLVPWSMTSLWNERWNAMSFGPHGFRANADPRDLYLRYFVFYLAPTVLFAGAVLFATLSGSAFAGIAGDSPEANTATLVVAGLALAAFFYLGLGLVAVAFFAQFYREAVSSLSWAGVDFSFTASTRAWIKLLLGDVALVVLTLGIGSIFLSYRHYAFAIRHLEAGGEIRLDELTRSTTATAGHGEGLFDAFDLGAV
jgi:uncharacterized membrane protein YjgN (DUF898 family)